MPVQKQGQEGLWKITLFVVTNADEQRDNRYGVKQMIYWRKTNDTQLVALSAKKGLKEAIWPDIYTFRSFLR